MWTPQQLWHNRISYWGTRKALLHRVTRAGDHKSEEGLWAIARIALALAIILLLGNSLSAQAEPGTTIMLPLVLTGGNRPPAAADALYQTLVNTPLIVSADDGVLSNVSDPEQDPLRAELESDVANGVLTLNENGSFDYMPDQGFIGQDKFTYRANDGTAVSDPATVRLTVSIGALENAPRIVSGEIAFTKRVIGTHVKRAHFAYAADFDGDGDLDVVATQYGEARGGIGGMVAWFENDGNGRFEEKAVDPDLAGAYPAHVADLDRDGDPDVLAGGYDADTFAWYRNDGGANFSRIEIDTAADGAHSIIANDLDKDGDNDLVTSGQDGNFISWYENDGTNSFELHIIDGSALGAKRAEVADIDGDGDKDVVAATFDSQEIAWYENDGNQNFGKHVIDEKAAGAYYVDPADVDGDGDLDIFSANRREDTVAWYRNDGADGFAKQIVDAAAMEVRTVVAVDMDRDGDDDALAASVDDDTIAWHENNGSGGFAKRVIDRSGEGAYCAAAVDMDFDGDFDVLSASRDSGEIALHTHIRAHKAMVAKRGVLVINSDLLLTVSVEENPSGLTYTISGAPEFGEIQLDGVPVPEGGTFTQDDVDGSRVTYSHTGANKAPDEFSFSVAGSGEDGAQPASGVFSISVS